MARPAGSRKRPRIPVLWDKECRSIPLAISTASGIQRMAARKGCLVRLYENCQELFADPEVGENVIVVGFETSRMPDMLEELKAAGKRVVITGMDADHIDARYSGATFSRRISTEQMLDFFLQKGCRRIALVGCGEHSVNDTVHSDAMLTYLAHYPQTHGQCFWYQNAMQESFHAFCQHWQEFDAVLCPSAFTAVAFLRFCEDQGLSIPENFLLGSMKDNYVARFCKPAITSWAVDFFAIGENAVMVWQYLQEVESENYRMRIAVLGHVLERESTQRPEGNSTPLPPPTPEPSLYQGGPFYVDPDSNALMRMERCLVGCDELDFQIIGLLLGDSSYEKIAEELFLSESSLQYRVRKLFKAMGVDNRRQFADLVSGCFTRRNHFSAPPVENAENVEHHKNG